VFRGPSSLVDRELAQAILSGIFVRLGDDPGRGIRDTKIQNFALENHGIKRLHQLGNRACEVPPVNIELKTCEHPWK
jgi:hypothetical protein